MVVHSDAFCRLDTVKSAPKLLKNWPTHYCPFNEFVDGLMSHEITSGLAIHEPECSVAVDLFVTDAQVMRTNLSADP